MMRGLVNSVLEPELVVRVHGPTGAFRDVSALIATGFTGFLALPPSTISQLSLTQLVNTHAVLADGSLEEYETYAGELNWFGQYRSIDILALGSALIGMKLLDGHELRVEAVEIRPLIAPTP